MYKNLSAEEARRGLVDRDMAFILGVSPSTYHAKKRNRTFKSSECAMLCQYFNMPFEYLFYDEEANIKIAERLANLKKDSPA